MLMRALFSHYRRHPLQLVALWLILSLATALWTGVWTLTQQARSSMTAGDAQLGGRQQVVREDGMPVSRADFVTLRRQGLCVMPWLELTLADGGPRQVGVDTLAMACAGEAAIPANQSGAGLALDGRPFMDIADAAALARQGAARAHLRLYLAGDDPQQMPAGWQLRSAAGQLSTGQLTDSFLLNLDALSVLVVLITALLVRSVYTLAISQRRQGMALLVRYGVPPKQLRWGLLFELLSLGVLALLPGFWLGVALSDLLSGGFAAALAGLFDTPVLATGRSGAVLPVIAAVMALVLLWAAADLFRDGQTRPWLPPWAGYLLVAGLSGIGGALVVWASTLAIIFLGTACLLAGIGLMTPALLRLGLPGCAPVEPLALWRQRESLVLVRRLALPLVALQYALATVIAVQALVTTFEETFYEWLDQRLSGDLYIEVPDTRSWQPAAPLLDASGSVAGWHPVLYGEGRLILADNRNPGQAVLVDVMATDHRSAMMHQWRLLEALPDAWARLGDGGVLVNEQLARRFALQPGDSVTLALAAGDAGQNRQVAGIYADYGRPAGEVLVAHTTLPAGWQPRYQSLSLSLLPTVGAADLDDLRAQLLALWQVSELRTRDNATIERLAVAIFDQTFALTRAISLLTLALAAVALMVTGWVVLKARIWYLHLLTIWGLAPGSSRWLLQRLTLGLMVRLLVASLPVGVMLTWILVARINPVAFGWSLPMAVYPGFWLQLLALMVLLGAAVALVAGRGLRIAGAEASTFRSARLVSGGLER